MTGQLDLLALLDAEEPVDITPRDARSRHCCTGDPLPPGHAVCGRCGTTGPAYPLSINHDLGHVGCPGVDYPAPPFRHVDPSLDRHDAEHWPACRCSHPRGVHGDAHRPPGVSPCSARCDCPGYRPP